MFNILFDFQEVNIAKKNDERESLNTDSLKIVEKLTDKYDYSR